MFGSWRQGGSPRESASSGFTSLFKPFGTSSPGLAAGGFDGSVIAKKPQKNATAAVTRSAHSQPGSGSDDDSGDGPMELFVGGLRSIGEVQEAELRAHFETFGAVQSLELTRDRRRHDQRGFCFVTFTHKVSRICLAQDLWYPQAHCSACHCSCTHHTCEISGTARIHTHISVPFASCRVLPSTAWTPLTRTSVA